MRILVVDEPWSQTPWLVQACRDRGLQVEVAVPRAGLARCRLLGVPAHELPADAQHQPAAIAALLATGNWQRILPVSERLLLACADIDDAAVDASLPVSRALLPLLADRRAMLRHVAGLGIDIPAQRPLPDTADIDAVARQLGWPLVMRGCQGSASSQVIIADHPAQARDALALLAATSDGEPFAQAFVPGDIVIVNGVFLDGVPLRAVCSMPVQRWPEPTSPSTVQRTFRDAALEALVRRIMGSLHYSGIGVLEFMKRPDGGHTFIEMNPRASGSVACTRAVGIDFAALYADLLAGTPPAAAGDPFAVPAGIDLYLFPQYLKARVASAGIRDALRHPLRWWRSLRGAPWRRPRLLLALSRQIFTGRRGPSRTAAAVTPPAGKTP